MIAHNQQNALLSLVVNPGGRVYIVNVFPRMESLAKGRASRSGELNEYTAIQQAASGENHY
jgi:hypothetical protein